MQTTANRWELLCRDFESERRSAKAKQHHGIAIRFLQALAFYPGALKIYKCFRRSDDPEMQTVIANREALLQETDTKQ